MTRYLLTLFASLTCLFAQESSQKLETNPILEPEIIPLHAPLPPVESDVPSSAFLPPEEFAPPLLRPLPKTPLSAPAPSDTVPIAAPSKSPHTKSPTYSEHFQNTQPEPFSKPLSGVGAQKEGNSFVYSRSNALPQNIDSSEQLGNMTIFGTHSTAQNVGNRFYFPIQSDATAVGNKFYYPSGDGKLMPSIR